MNVSSRERILIWAFGLIGVGVVGYVFIAMLLMPLLSQRKTNRELETDIAVAEAEYGATQNRNKKAMAEILPRSLPADLDFSKREYQAALTRLLLESKVPAGYTVRDQPPDTRGIPELVKNRPAYIKIAYAITISKVDIATLMTFLKKYYDLNLLHQITKFTLKRGDNSKIDADPRYAKDRTDLDVTLITEALLLDGAPARKTLLAAPVSAGSVLGAAGFFSLENTTPEIGRGIAPYQISQILANPARDYAYVIGKDAMHGKLPVPPPDKPKEKEKVVEIPPGPDISAYIQLVTLVKSSDGTAHVEIFDKWNNYDFEINMKQVGEKLGIDAMRFMKTKKSNFYPDGRMKDASYPKGGNVLAFADEKSSTNRTFKIYGVDGNALVLGETAGADPKAKPTGKFTKPPQDLKPAILGSVFAGVPVPKGEKYFRWEVGVPLKGIKELNAADAQKAIQRALGGLLEATPVSAPVPVAPPPLEVAPKPNGVLEEGK